MDRDWQDLIAGKRQALERLYRTHIDALLSYGQQFADEGSVEDQIHDLFVQLWDKHALLTPDVKPRPYLLISLRNALLRQHKRSTRQSTLDQLSAPTSPTSSVEQQLVAAETSTARSHSLAAAVDELSAREREVINLRFVQNLDYDAIVEISGMNYQVARNTLSRAIKKLRVQLAGTTISLLLVTKLPVLSLCSESLSAALL